MELFDYNAVTDEQKKAIEEVMILAKEEGNEEFAEMLSFKFGVKEAVKVPPENFAFTQECEKLGIKVWIMGYESQNANLPNSEENPMLPILSITESSTKLESLIASIRNNVVK